MILISKRFFSAYFKLKAIKKRRAFEDIVRQIQLFIDKKKLKQGDKLPTEAELAEAFKVSRGTVREAIFFLEAMKHVERRQGCGTYVIASAKDLLVERPTMSLFSEGDDITHVYCLRKIIEPEVACLASERRSLEEMRNLEEVLKEQHRKQAQGVSYMSVNSDFHRLLARMTKNRVLERLILALSGHIENIQDKDKRFQTQERNQILLRGHYEILDAIKDNNGSGARRAMQRHLEDVENTLFEKREKTSKDLLWGE